MIFCRADFRPSVAAARRFSVPLFSRSIFFGAVRAAFPDAAFVALVDGEGRVLCAERTPPSAPFGRLPAAATVRRRDAPDLFDALGGGDRAEAVVSNDLVWLVASDELRDDDRAWVAALLES